MYRGAAACAACHPAATARWEASAHAHAIGALEEAQRAFDPSCLRCHVTGLGHPGGFRSHNETPGLVGVGCEACHGPASDHLAAPGPGYGDLPLDGSACVGCHTHDNSPDFSWARYWPQVKHSH